MREMTSEQFRAITCRTEAQIQRAVCNWLRAKGIKFMPGWLAGTADSPQRLRLAKEQGYDPGMPDLFVARAAFQQTPSGGWLRYGLFMEFKRPSWKPPKSGMVLVHWEAQLACAKRLRDEGYRVEIPVQSFERANEILREHCGG